MGKSHKKVKSDRINALRKQYDAFLEEDKKRKERNEYILGRLDKMRYSTALVPVRHKPITLTSRPTSAFYLGYQPDVRAIPPQGVNNNQLQIIPDAPVQKIDDTYLIQEISKNYILIPKLRLPFTSNYIQQATPIHNSDSVLNAHETRDMNTLKTNDMTPSSNENTDWKNKYEILNILKKEDKEKQTVKFADEHISKSLLNQEPLLSNMYENIGDKFNNDVIADIHSDTGYKYLDELPEKDMPVEKVECELKKDNEASVDAIIEPEPVSHINTDPTNEDFVRNVDAVADIGHKLGNTNLEYNYVEANDPNIIYVPGDIANAENHVSHYTGAIDSHLASEQTNYVEQFEPVYDVNALSEDISATEIDKENENMNVISNQGDLTYEPEAVAMQLNAGAQENVAYVDEQDAIPAQVISSGEFMEEINNYSAISDSKPIEYATENVNIQELAPNIDYQMKTAVEVPSEQNVVDKIGVDTTLEQEPKVESVPEIKEVPDEKEEAVDMAGIEAFDAEQREMFYSENPVQNYGYQQGEVNVYEQAYQQSNPYEQNQEYNYYDNTQTEAYPADVVEGEEEPLRYDQTYHQQYVDPYEKAYEKQPEDPPQFEEPHPYVEMQSEEVEQVYDQQNYESKEQVESVLDAEEGYTDKKDMAKTEQVEKTDAENKTPEKVA